MSGLHRVSMTVLSTGWR